MSDITQVNSNDRPAPEYTWVSIVECARWDLQRARELEDQEQITALLRTIATAEREIEHSSLFPMLSIHTSGLKQQRKRQPAPDASDVDEGRSALFEYPIVTNLESAGAGVRATLAQPQEPKLTELERRVMEAVWSRGKGSVREILEDFPEPRPAYSTIQTVVFRLERKKALRRGRKVGNALIFEPIVFPDAPKPAALHQLFDEVLSFFGSGPKAMVARLIESGMLTLADLREMEETLE